MTQMHPSKMKKLFYIRRKKKHPYKKLYVCFLFFIFFQVVLAQSSTTIYIKNSGDEFQAVSSAPKIKILAEVSAYTASIDETDDDPGITASGDEVYVGGVACPSHLAFGVKVLIKNKIYTCNDRMAQRYRKTNHFDIFMKTKGEAIAFGRQKISVTVLD